MQLLVFLTNQEQSGYHAQSDFGGTCVVKLDNTIEFAIRWVEKGQIASLNLKELWRHVSTVSPFTSKLLRRAKAQLYYRFYSDDLALVKLVWFQIFMK